MSIEKIVGSTISICSFAITASFVVYIQHTEEQYSTPHFISLDPIHCKNAILRGIMPSDGRSINPACGPLALNIRSNWILVTTFKNLL